MTKKAQPDTGQSAASVKEQLPAETPPDNRKPTPQDQALADAVVSALLFAQSQLMQAPPEPPRIVRVVGEVDFDTVGGILDTLHAFDSESDAPIRVDITSPGGVVDCGFAVYGALQACRSPIVTIVFGCASSIASVILQGGQRRIMAPGSTLMIHEVLRGFGDGSHSVTDVRHAHKSMAAMQSRLERFMAQCTGQPIAQIREWCLEERAFSAREAVRYGFADQAIPSRHARKRQSTS